MNQQHSADQGDAFPDGAPQPHRTGGLEADVDPTRARCQWNEGQQIGGECEPVEPAQEQQCQADADHHEEDGDGDPQRQDGRDYRPDVFATPRDLVGADGVHREVHEFGEVERDRRRERDDAPRLGGDRAGDWPLGRNENRRPMVSPAPNAKKFRLTVAPGSRGGALVIDAADFVLSPGESSANPDVKYRGHLPGQLRHRRLGLLGAGHGRPDRQLR